MVGKKGCILGFIGRDGCQYIVEIVEINYLMADIDASLPAWDFFENIRLLCAVRNSMMDMISSAIALDTLDVALSFRQFLRGID